ncbi:hypothetical protein SVIOM74S_02598 [Streptomyces violarus]
MPAGQPGHVALRNLPESRFEGRKRTYEKPLPISTQVLLDRERCVLCARCTRFSNQVAGDPMIELIERGALQQVGTGEGDPFESYFSGNTIQICPVAAHFAGATDPSVLSIRLLVGLRALLRRLRHAHRPPARTRLRGAALRMTPGQRGVDLRQGAVRVPVRAAARHRLETPLVRNAEGELDGFLAQALQIAAQGLLASRGRTGVLTGGRLTIEDAYAYSKFARVALDTNDIDFRARVHSGEEADFLAAQVAGRGRDLDGTGVTYAALEKAPAVLLVGFEAEEEAPASSCGCARPGASTGRRSSPWPRTPRAVWRRPAGRCCRRPPAPRPSGWTRSRGTSAWRTTGTRRRGAARRGGRDRRR